MKENTITLMKKWRHAVHQRPELAYCEYKTSAMVASILRDLGLEVHEGIATTGVVGVLRRGNADAARVAIRADMDALPIQEKTALPYASVHSGIMHACGHDGHTAMLLGAVSELVEVDGLNGTAYFIFQPAEENEAGAKKMIEEGLFEKFPTDVVFALHNAPGIPVGSIAARGGVMLASFSTFSCSIKGAAGHSSTPSECVDSIEVATEVMNHWRSLGSRLYPVDEQPLIAVTKIQGGNAYNVIAEEVVLSGSTRCLAPPTQKTLEKNMRKSCETIAALYGAVCEFEYKECYPVLVNDQEWVDYGLAVAEQCPQINLCDSTVKPHWGSEDFAFMLKEKPGAYFLLGHGVGDRGGVMLHDSKYDFNDDVLTVGAQFWIYLVSKYLT